MVAELAEPGRRGVAARGEEEVCEGGVRVGGERERASVVRDRATGEGEGAGARGGSIHPSVSIRIDGYLGNVYLYVHGEKGGGQGREGGRMGGGGGREGRGRDR